METYANPFAYLALPWVLGFFSSFLVGVVTRVLLPTKELDKLLG